MTQFLVRLFIKNSEDTNNIKVREDYGILSGIVGIICNLLLCGVKITIGALTASISVMADGLNNLTDMGSSIVTMLGFKMAAKPADKDHPFGHGRIEYLSAFIVAMIILLVGFELIKSSAQAIISGQSAPKYSLVTLIILVCSAAFKLWMYLFNKALSKKIDSEALMATAQDSLNDSISTFVIMIAAAVTYFVKLPFNLDAVMGIIVGLFIIYSGIITAKETIDKLLGEPPSEELLELIESSIMAFSDFEAIHDLIVHNYGPGRCLASVHVEVSQDIDVVHCHEQVDLCEKFVLESLGVELTIHTDPIDTESELVKETRMAIAKAVASINEKATIHDFRMTPMAETRTNLIFDAVLPMDAKISESEFKDKICSLAKEINKTFVCVITVDRDYTGK
ncbi:MAG: cation diffusion facilitator family transporter [Acutalibacteraceae bacterium]|nr:cation diffusion facilitator family transporter [Acutalibacteraceae bacterium]